MEILLEPHMFGRATRWEASSGALWVVVDTDGKTQHVVRDKCAHMGSPVRSTASGFMCDTHGWSYGLDGSNDVAGSPGLEEVVFSQSGNRLSIELREGKEILPRLSSVLDGTEKLELLAHASFCLTAGDTRLLFDPWLFGDAYWGSWRHFPRVEITRDSLVGVTAVVITHPHPDHFHPETLALLPRTVPVYFPNFPSQIIPKVLKRLGFTALYPSDWESVIDVGEGVSFAFLRPSSVWEDSSVLVRVKNWLWLNQNDAGSPLRDDLLPESIDLLSSAFDVGASGYPLTWDIADNKVDKILANARSQMLESIALRCKQTKSRAFAPFAGWWRHARPEHQHYAGRLPHTSMADVAKAVEGAGTKFLQTLPGSQFSLKSMDLVECQEALDGLEQPWEVSDSEVSFPRLSREDLVSGIEGKLASLASMSQAVDCEHVEFTVSVKDMDVQVSRWFGSAGEGPVTRIRVELSTELASLYVEGDETVTWDNLSIGYWGRWSREPDIYPVRFMRLLQLGYVPELASLDSKSNDGDACLDTPVGTLLERSPELATALLSRAGLPCVSCAHLKDESLRDALAIHSVPKEQRQRLMSEVSALLSAPSVLSE